MKIPAGPDGSFTSFIAEGNPSRSVRRLPSGPMIEMRPECRATVPVSETSRLPWFVNAEPSGSRKPVITSEHCAETERLSKEITEMRVSERPNRLSGRWFMGVSFLKKYLCLFCVTQEYTEALAELVNTIQRL